MKNIKKFLLYIFLIVLAICQIPNKVKALTKEEVMNIIDYQVIESEDEEPDDYDVLVNLDDFEVDETIPCYRTSIDTILYQKYGLFNINFFENNSENNNTNEKWEEIHNLVLKVFRISRYIAFAIMLTLLIYIALILVTATLSEKNTLPMQKKILGIAHKPESILNRNAREKKLIEQWLISLFVIAIVPFGLSVIVYFSNAVTDITYKSLNYSSSNENNTTENIDCNYIKVYAKYRIKPAANGTQGGGNGIYSNGSVNNISNGNSESSSELRQKVIDLAKSQDDLGVPVGYCEMWVEHVYEKALERETPNQCCAHKAGQNSIVSTSKDDIVPGAAVFSYKSSSGTNCSGCGQDAGHVGIYIGDGKIASCTGGISIKTIEEWEQSWEFSGWGWLPGVEDLADGAVPESVNTSPTTVSVDDTEYTFKTSLEGLMEYETQYNTEDTKLKVGACFVIQFALTAFKCFLFFIFFVRMLVIAVITATAPILALINAFTKITKGRGILRNVFIIYLYFALLKPAIGLFYEVMVREHITWHESNPITILLVIIIIVILVIWSYIKLRTSLQITGLYEKAKRKMQIIKNKLFGF